MELNGKKTPGGAGTHKGHTAHTDAYLEKNQSVFRCGRRPSAVSVVVSWRTVRACVIRSGADLFSPGCPHPPSTLSRLSAVFPYRSGLPLQTPSREREGRGYTVKFLGSTSKQPLLA